MATNAAISTYQTLYNVTGLPTVGGKTAVDLQQSLASVGVNPSGIRTSNVHMRIAFTLGTLSSVTLGFEVSDDGGTTYYRMYEYDVLLDASADDFQVEIGPFVGSETHVRPNVIAASGTSGTLIITGRLGGIYTVTA